MTTRRDFVRSLPAASAFLFGPNSAQAQDADIRLGVLRLSSAATTFVAIDKGFFQAEDLQVDVAFFDAAAQLPVAVAARTVDIGATAFTAAFFNIAAKGGLRLICGDGRPHAAFPNNQLVASRAGHDGGLRAFADVSGRRIGITTVGSSFHYQLGAIAAKFAFPISQVELVPLQTLANLGSSLAAGRLDGAILPSTVAAPLIRSGSGVFVGNIADVDTTQASGVFTRPDFIAADRTKVERFLRAHRRAMEFCNKAVNRLDDEGRPIDGKERDELFAIVAARTGQTSRQFAGSFSFYDPSARLDAEDVRKVLGFWQERGLVSPKLTVENIVDASFAA